MKPTPGTNFKLDLKSAPRWTPLAAIVSTCLLSCAAAHGSEGSLPGRKSSTDWPGKRVDWPGQRTHQSARHGHGEAGKETVEARNESKNQIAEEEEGFLSKVFHLHAIKQLFGAFGQKPQ